MELVLEELYLAKKSYYRIRPYGEIRMLKSCVHLILEVIFQRHYSTCCWILLQTFKTVCSISGQLHHKLPFSAKAKNKFLILDYMLEFIQPNILIAFFCHCSTTVCVYICEREMEGEREIIINKLGDWKTC